MTRTIKFRGKRVDGKGWAEGCFISYWIPDGERYVGIMGWKGDHFEVHPETVGQFTGLTDKDGKEIFEGDEVNNMVVWGAVISGYITYNTLRHYWHVGAFPLSANIDFSESQVIGNIHDK